MEFAENNHILPETQFGFRRGRTTSDPLFTLITETTKALNSGKCVLATFLDIERAFDKVWLDGLYFKLLKLNIPIIYIRCLKAILSERSSRVRVGNQLSQPFSPKSGVPQGSPLSPVLYIIYGHDIPKPISPLVSANQFADDSAYWCSAYTARQAFKTMQRQLNVLQVWLSKWRIKPNPSKTQLILFVHQNRTQRQNFQSHNMEITLWGQTISPQPSARYLGLDLTKTLNWTTHVNRVLATARKRMNLLILVRGRLRGCHPSTLIHTYKTFIRPVFDYAANVLSAVLPDHLIKRYSSLERRILRRASRQAPWTKNNAVYDTISFSPIHERFQALLFSYSNRIHNSDLHHIKTLLTQPVNFPRKPKHKYPFPPLIMHTQTQT